MERQTLPRLMLVTDRRRLRVGELVPRVVDAVHGGVRLVQFREPGLDDSRLSDWIDRIRARVDPDVTWIVNGRPELARRLGVGLHLPARHPLRSSRGWRVSPLGRSVHAVEEAARVASESPDYLVVGTLYPTASKPGHPGCGPGRLTRIAERLPRLPLYGIGGIDLARVVEPLRAGAHGVAVCGAILGANDVQQAASALLAAIRATGGQGRKEARRTRANEGSTQAT